MKRLLSLFLCLLLVLSLSSCAQKSDAVRIGVLKGPTGLGASYLMEQNEQGTSKNTYEFTIAGSADELTGRLLSGDLDLAALPTNAIATLYNKSQGEIVALGVNTLGVLYVLENGNSVSTVSDLAGKTIVAAGQGTTVEYILSAILAGNSVEADVVWTAEHSETVTQALSGNADLVVLPEPMVTSTMLKNSDFHVVLGLTDEWNALGYGVLPMGGFAVRKAFLEEHPDEVANFVGEYGSSVDFINMNPADGAALAEKFDIIAAAVAEKAAPRCNMVWLFGDGYRASYKEFLTVLYEQNPASIGGALPSDDFYS